MRNSARCFLAIADGQGNGRALELDGRAFIVALGLAAFPFKLMQELEVRGVAVRGVYVSTS